MKRVSGHPHVIIAVLLSLLWTALSLNRSGVAASAPQPTLTVTNLNDSGPGSLRDAIASASPGDTINFGVTGTITLTSGEIAINKNLTITGPGVANLTISGNNSSRIFFISPGVIGPAGPTVNISDLTISNGRSRGFDGGGSTQGSGGGGAAGMGGGLFINGGTVTLSRVDFRNNTAVGGNGGGTGMPNNAQLAGSGGGGVGGAPGGGPFGGPLCSFDSTTCFGSGSGGSGGNLGGTGGSSVFPPINGGNNGHDGGDGAGGGGAAVANVFPPANQASPNGGGGGFGGGGGGGAGRGSGGAGGLGGGGGAGGGVVGGVGGGSVAFGGTGGRATSFAENPGGGGGAGLGGALFIRTGSLQLNGNNVFANNSTTGGIGGASIGSGINGSDGQGKGGAIFIHNQEASAFVTVQPTYSGNTAPNAGTSLTDNNNVYGAFNCAAGGLTLSPANLPNGVTGAAYPNPVTASGGIAPYNFAVASGAVPTGLTFNADGTWSGTPSAIGIFNFTISATTADGCFGSRSYTVTVTGPNEQLSITAANPFTLQQGSLPITAQIAAVSDANQAANTLVVTATPQSGTGVSVSNITIDALGNVTARLDVSCTATNSTFTLTVTNNQNATKTATLTVNVTANTAPTLGNYSNTSLSVGSGITITPSAPPTDSGSVSATASAQGFTGTFLVNLTTGALTIGGAGPPGTFTVQVKVYDNCGASVTRTFTLTVNGEACTSTSFNAPNQYPTSSNLTSAIAVADFNRDGYPDVAVANNNFSSGSVSVLLSNGSGGFANSVYATGGIGTADVETGDLNRDGFPDLVMTLVGSSPPLCVMLNNGSGGFSAPLFYSGGTIGFIRVVTADFNLDGKLDVATTAQLTSGSSGVALFLGNGQGGLSGPTFYGVAGNSIPLVTGDFNQDGFPDLATLNKANNISVLLGTGNGSFGGATIFTAGLDLGTFGTTVALVTADFNLDGKLDLAASQRTNVSGQTAGELSVLLGVGNGSFGAPMTSNLDRVDSLAAGDFNEDGKPDLTTGIRNTTTLRVLPGLGTGSFAAPILLNTDNDITALEDANVAVADFNLDGRVDIAVLTRQDVFNDFVTVLRKACTAPPTIGCPGNITKSTDPGQCSAIVNFAPTVTGTPAPTITCTPPSGSAFPKGTTTVTCTASNGVGSNASCSFNVAVADSQSPSISCPANLTRATDANQCAAAVTYTQPSATDNCPGVVTVTCSPASGAAFPKGTTTVTCSATDASGNNASCNFTVTVNDAQPPALAGCPTNIVKNTDPNACTAVTTFTTPTATDNCPGVGTPACTPASGFSFPKGVTTVTCSVSDSAAPPNTASCSFTVTVNDAQPPSMTCPANIVKSTDPNSCTAATTYTTPTATDNCSAGAVSCVPASGFAFTKGVTTVTCTVSDTATPPNTTTCSFTVTVNDTQAPTITCPASLTRSTDPNVCSAVVTFAAPTVSDNCAGVGMPSCVPPSGTTFAKGVTTVTCTVSDAAAVPNTSSCSFTVTVNDTQPPSITCPANIVKSTDPNLCTAVVTYTTPTPADNCPGVGAVTCVPASGTAFAKGVTTVTCTVGDAATPPNTSTCSFTVTVNDTQAPAMTCPANIVKSTDPNSCSAVTTYTTPAATDNCTGLGAVTCSPASGSVFPKGVTTVTCSVSDGATTPNTTTCSFSVTVNDTLAPVITCPANIVKSTDPNSCSAVTTFTVTATDNCPGVTVVSNPPSGTTFPKGTTTVTSVATDTSGNTATCTFTVTVNDTQPPSITCPASVTVPTAPNLCSAVVNYLVTASDNCPGVVVASGPTSGSTFPKGTTTVTATATDASGNTSTCTFTVTVVDMQAPTIVCPGNLTATAGSPGAGGLVVTYPSPTLADNCPGVTAACVPASGSTFPIGITTVTCTATDVSGNTATCAFTVTTFDVCIQDDSSSAVLLWNSATGDYLFCCGGLQYTGRGTSVVTGNMYNLTDNTGTRRVKGTADKSTSKGTGSLQSPPGVQKCSITDRDIRNNTCACSLP